MSRLGSRRGRHFMAITGPPVSFVAYFAAVQPGPLRWLQWIDRSSASTYAWPVSLFRINLVIADPRDTTRTSPSINALVDAGSELTWIPAPLLESTGIVRLKKKTFRTASNQTLLRDVGYGVIRVEGFETIDEVVFAEPSDMTLLGVRTLEGFSATVDTLGRKLVATSTIAA